MNISTKFIILCAIAISVALLSPLVLPATSTTRKIDSARLARAAIWREEVIAALKKQREGHPAAEETLVKLSRRTEANSSTKMIIGRELLQNGNELGYAILRAGATDERLSNGLNQEGDYLYFVESALRRGDEANAQRVMKVRLGATNLAEAMARAETGCRKSGRLDEAEEWRKKRLAKSIDADKP
jgi:hypothetical protein